MARSSLVCSIWQRYNFIPNIRCYQPEKSADPVFQAESVSSAWHVVRENAQKTFPKTVAAGNYSGITHLHDDIYAVVSDKSDSALFFKFRIQLNPLSGELEHVENLGYSETVREKGLDHEAIARVSDSTLVTVSEGLFRFAEYPVYGMNNDKCAFRVGESVDVRKLKPTDFVWSSTHSPSDFHPNYGYESLAYDSVRHLLWSISESTLRNDGEPASWQNGEANRLRLFAFDWSKRSDTSSMFGSVRHPIAVSYAYRMDAPAIRKRPHTYAMGVSELCVLPDGQLLVLEREVYVPKSKIGASCQCKLYLVNPAEEQVFPMSASFASDDVPYVRKTLLTQWSTRLTLLGRSFANYEGMCLGPQLADGSQVLILLSDSQDQYAGVLKDWFKTIVLAK